jgi:hypothetical protein
MKFIIIKYHEIREKHEVFSIPMFNTRMWLDDKI